MSMLKPSPDIKGFPSFLRLNPPPTAFVTVHGAPRRKAVLARETRHDAKLACRLLCAASPTAAPRTPARRSASSGLAGRGPWTRGHAPEPRLEGHGRAGGRRTRCGRAGRLQYVVRQ